MVEKLKFNRSRMEWLPPKTKTPFEKIDDSIERARSDGFSAGIIIGIGVAGLLWMPFLGLVIYGHP